jgi:hypothetical protein
VDWFAIAALDPTATPQLTSAFLVDYFAGGQEPFGRMVIGDLPSLTTNKAEDLITRDAVEQAYVSYIEWLERAGRTSLSAEAQRVRKLIDEEEDHDMRTEQEARWSEYLSSSTEEARRRALVRLYLDQSYATSHWSELIPGISQELNED